MSCTMKRDEPEVTTMLILFTLSTTSLILLGLIVLLELLERLEFTVDDMYNGSALAKSIELVFTLLINVAAYS